MLIDPAEKLGAPGTVLPPNDICELLARRLAAETRGTVLFDAPSRGRYATDASIYQIMPVGVLVPRSAEDIRTALAIARDLKVPVLARGGGTSQCGQTTGAALVIDNTKHFRNVIDVDVADRTATVEPGIVLDHLNARLKPHGLWFPVDVSTSAQATLGGMAGNNSCGSRSIAYGNMVHNVRGARAWLSDGDELDFGPVAVATGRVARIGEFVHALAHQHRDAIADKWPKVLRRVGGYNLDIFDNQSERPYAADGSVNLAHLLVGSEGTLAYTKSLTLQLAELPRAKVLGIVNFTSFHAAMDAAQHIVKLGPSAVELVDRTMIELALGNPAFRATMETALIGRPAAILLVEFSGDDKAALLPRLARLDELMGDLGLPGCVVRMSDDAPQKNLWEVRKAGLNIMMSLKGDGKPVSFIEDCAVPLDRLAEYTDALTEVFARHGSRGTWYAHASVGTLHVRPILDMRVAGPGGGAAKMRAIAEEASALVRKYKGAFSGEHGDGLCRGEWIAWQFGPALNDAFRAIKVELDPLNLFNPGKIIDPPRMDDGAMFRFAPPGTPTPYRRIPLVPVLDWSAWNVQADPVTEVTTPPGTGGDVTGGFAKAVEMCNNNGHCRKFDAGTMCPSYRVTRDEQHLTLGATGPRRLHQLGHARHDGPVRGLQGLPPRVPDGRRHGEDEDRVPRALHGQERPVAAGPADRPLARLRARCEPRPVAGQPAQNVARWSVARREVARAVRKANVAHMARRHLLALQGCVAVLDARPDARRCAGGPTRRGAVRRHLQRHLRERERACRGARAERRGLQATHGREGRRPSLLRAHVPRQRPSRASQGQGLGIGRRLAAVRRMWRRHRRPRAVLSADFA
jgi:FAD/FMN-containing dehydrogenase